MTSGATIGDSVRQLLRLRAAGADLADMGDHVPLGPGGLGLDSITLAELLLDCGERFGVPVPAELLAEEPLTVGRLIDHLSRAVR
jgi:hypothetical protein